MSTEAESPTPRPTLDFSDGASGASGGASGGTGTATTTPDTPGSGNRSPEQRARAVAARARAALRTFPEERSETEMDAIWQWLHEQPPACQRFFCASTVQSLEDGATQRSVRLCQYLRLVSVPNGTVVYKQGHAGDSFHYILKGSVSVHHRPSAALSKRRTEEAAAASAAAVAAAHRKAAQDERPSTVGSRNQPRPGSASGVPKTGASPLAHLLAKRSAAAGLPHGGHGSGGGAAPAAAADADDAGGARANGHDDPGLARDEAALGAQVFVLHEGQHFGEVSASAAAVRAPRGHGQGDGGAESDSDGSVAAVGGVRGAHGEVRRDATVVARGQRDSTGKVIGKTEVLAIPAHVYGSTTHKVFRPMIAAHTRRTLRLSKLHAFNDWPQPDLAYLAYWVTDERVAKGEFMFEEGDPMDDSACVHFLVSGSVELRLKRRDQTRFPYHTLQVVAPFEMFGLDEVLHGEEERRMDAQVLQTSIIASLPVKAFRALVLAKEARDSYRTHEKLKMVQDERDSWSAIVLSDSNGSLNALPPNVLRPIQARFFGCALCGRYTHPVEDCAHQPPAPPTGGPVGAGGSVGRGLRPSSMPNLSSAPSYGNEFQKRAMVQAPQGKAPRSGHATADMGDRALKAAASMRKTSQQRIRSPGHEQRVEAVIASSRVAAQGLNRTPSLSSAEISKVPRSHTVPPGSKPPAEAAKESGSQRNLKPRQKRHVFPTAEEESAGAVASGSGTRGSEGGQVRESVRAAMEPLERKVAQLLVDAGLSPGGSHMPGRPAEAIGFKPPGVGADASASKRDEGHSGGSRQRKRRTASAGVAAGGDSESKSSDRRGDERRGGGGDDDADSGGEVSRPSSWRRQVESRMVARVRHYGAVPLTPVTDVEDEEDSGSETDYPDTARPLDASDSLDVSDLLSGVSPAHANPRDRPSHTPIKLGGGGGARAGAGRGHTRGAGSGGSGSGGSSTGLSVDLSSSGGGFSNTAASPATPAPPPLPPPSPGQHWL